jgi:hypothetical protein
VTAVGLVVVGLVVVDFVVVGLVISLVVVGLVVVDFVVVGLVISLVVVGLVIVGWVVVIVVEEYAISVVGVSVFLAERLANPTKKNKTITPPPYYFVYNLHIYLLKILVEYNFNFKSNL